MILYLHMTAPELHINVGLMLTLLVQRANYDSSYVRTNVRNDARTYARTYVTNLLVLIKLIFLTEICKQKG